MKGKLCIGLTGRMASGKGEAIRVLNHYGFHEISLSDIVRDEARKAGKEITRSQMQDIGDQAAPIPRPKPKRSALIMRRV